MADQEIFTGQKVWLENRRHPTIPNWMDCYGVIVNVIQEWDEDEEENTIDSVICSFDAGPEVIVPVDELSVWDDRSQCWLLYGYPR